MNKYYMTVSEIMFVLFLYILEHQFIDKKVAIAAETTEAPREKAEALMFLYFSCSLRISDQPGGDWRIH